MYLKWLVSILICTYNAEKTIKKTLNSCLDQTYKNFEILIHDDQSKDKTIEIIKWMNNNKIKIIESWKKLWPYGWLNFLLDNSKWEYIAIQDHDDIWHPQKLEKQINYLNNHNWIVWCWSHWLEYYEANKQWYIVKPNTKFLTHWVAHTSLVFRNSKKRYDTKTDYLSDWYFLKKFLSDNKPLIYVYPEVLTLHYNKKFWENYSNFWFQLNTENVKRYFYIKWKSFSNIFRFIWFLFLQILPKKIKNNVNYITVKKYNNIQSKEDLERDKIINCLLSYL